MTPITVTGIESHRNGVCGMGFWLVKFTYEGIDLLCVRHYKSDDKSKPDFYSVINPADISDCYRGDHFIDAIDGAIELYQQKLIRQYA